MDLVDPRKGVRMVGRPTEAELSFLKARVLPVMVPGEDNALAESEALEPQDPAIDEELAQALDEMNKRQYGET